MVRLQELVLAVSEFAAAAAAAAATAAAGAGAAAAAGMLGRRSSLLPPRFAVRHPGEKNNNFIS